MTEQSAHAEQPDRPALPARSRGVIGLLEENCTVVHAVRARVPGLVHLHRLPRGDRRRSRAGGRRHRGAATCSTASPSTSRCACTAGSASTSARSTRCSGRPSSTTPAPDVRDLAHERTACATGSDGARRRLRSTRPLPSPNEWALHAGGRAERWTSHGRTSGRRLPESPQRRAGPARKDDRAPLHQRAQDRGPARGCMSALILARRRLVGGERA